MYFDDISTIYFKKNRFTADDVICAYLLKRLSPQANFKFDMHNITLNDDELSFGYTDSYYDYKNCEETYDAKDNLLTNTYLLWEDLYDYVLESFDINNFDDANELFYESVLYPLMLSTRFEEKKNYYVINRIVDDIYKYTKGETIYKFEKALRIVTIYLDNVFREIYGRSELKNFEEAIWNKAKEEAKDGIFVLDAFIHWRKFYEEDPECGAKIIIFESMRGGYNVVSTDENRIKIKESKYLTFLHNSKFMGSTNTVNEAIKAARITLGLSENI